MKYLGFPSFFDFFAFVVNFLFTRLAFPVQ